MRTVKEIYVNVSKAELINAQGGTINPFVIYRGSQFIFRVNLLNDDLTPFILNASDSFYAGVNDNYTRTNDDYCQSYDDQFNISADWDDIDLTEGKISFRLNTDTELAENIGSVASKYYLIEVWGISSGLPILLLQCPVLIKNIAVEVTEYSSSSSESSESMGNESSSSSSSSSEEFSESSESSSSSSEEFSESSESSSSGA